MDENQCVYIVDDDEAMRESMQLLLEMLGYRVQGFASAKAFLGSCADDDRGCLVLDMRMPEMTGLELQQALRKRGYDLPIIFLSGFGDVPTTVRAVQSGAVDFLEKPVSKSKLTERIERAFEIDRRRRDDASAVEAVRTRYATLTPREQQVMTLATQGLSNKDIARELEISPRTVETHRAKVMEKMEADSLAMLCNMVALCPPGEGESAGVG
ncbi:response regulator [Lamprobacter modestohalophilus]|uniref:response regulator transcription factor n=1 Tax=Lamprobacter modestohalophilus TaxID=1064514 RepID=UPI002ADEC7DB|nr:response regulator [Lamprobacter modestohalophilus]MEA1052206.1 response regulator [Lamprobacter modestohalophilus]